MPSPVDNDLIDLLVKRDGTSTDVVLRDSTRFVVFNIAWGYDDGDVHAHVTTNISPSLPDASIDFFSTSDVASVRDPSTGTVLLEPGW